MTTLALPIGPTTLEKLHVPAAPGCDCEQCTFIRNAYACACSVCGRSWQAAYASVEAARQAMETHARACEAQQQAREAARIRRLRPPKPAYYPVVCGWCGGSWPRRFTTKTASQRFLREHTRGCYLHHQQESA